MAIDHDRLFKELLTHYFEEFMKLFFPEVHQSIDFNDFHFLSEELFTDIVEGEKYRVDVLAETKLKGEDAFIIVHVEPQSYEQRYFQERMFIYFSRLYETHRCKILPIAIFSYDKIRDEPDTFEIHFPFADILSFHFLKLELKKQNWRSFIRTENPVAAALLSKMGYTEDERVEVKKEFLRMIVRMNIDAARQTLLTRFFETYLPLSVKEENQLIEEVEQMDKKEGEQIMEVMVSYERRGLEKGKEQGREQGIIQGKDQGKREEKRNIAINMLQKGIETNVIVDVTGLTLEEVKSLGQD
ncbi:putative transposase/invertase (TIGR01784 family) [Salibacterium salarium]|uniref:Rpn family recombination-promoting nuclease/putative transposase n=1 Tax=Salibacterium salarium TaxID=284579 RepID=UPI002788F6CB|nr:Rpn family recombination-promoting nuclease/putative transposase [Salibacterium salarium]MDQ0297900.1 putative transposase/invertase (TIGR01784 family) [Salibacterium salarium]